MAGIQLYAENIASNILLSGQTQSFSFSLPISEYQTINLSIPTSFVNSQNCFEFINYNNAGYRFRQLTTNSAIAGDLILESFTNGFLPGTSLFTFSESGGTFTADIPLILSSNPTSAFQAATKQYVDAIGSGLTFKNACYAGTTSNLTATYNNGVAGVGATLTNSGAFVVFAVDGVTPPLNSRILVKNQSTAFQNGIYTLTTIGDAISVPYVLTRSTDYNAPADIRAGDFVVVENGAVNQNFGWIQTGTVITIGTDSIAFSQFGNLGTVTEVFPVAGQTTVANGTTTPIIGLSSAIINASFILQTASSSLTGAQVLGSLGTGLVKNTTTTGVLSIATPITDYYAPGEPTTLLDDFTPNVNPNLSYGNLGVGTNALNSLTLHNSFNTYNMALGSNSLYSLTSGFRNSAVGSFCLFNLTSGSANTGAGSGVLSSLTSGNSNTVIGAISLNALTNGSQNTVIGASAADTYSSYNSCCFFGFNADASASNLTNAIAIGANAVVGASNSMALGDSTMKVGIRISTPQYPLDVGGASGIAINANSNRIIGVATPTSSTDATNKAYVDASTLSISTAKFILQTSNASLPNAQVLGSLTTGLLKNTTGTGVLSIATAGTDYYAPLAPATIIADPVAVNISLSRNALASLTTGTANAIFCVFGGQLITTGTGNCIFSSTTGQALTTGNSNILVGQGAGQALNVGSSNVLIGTSAAPNLTTPSFNLIIGTGAAANLQTGATNVILGTGAGSWFGGGFSSYGDCVFIGNNASASASNLTNAIAIGANSLVSASNSMVLGNSTMKVGIGTSTPQYPLDVGVISGISINANIGRIIGVATPTSATDAANKAYVDASTITLTGSVTGSGVINSSVVTSFNNSQTVSGTTQTFNYSSALTTSVFSLVNTNASALTYFQAGSSTDSVQIGYDNNNDYSFINLISSSNDRLAFRFNGTGVGALTQTGLLGLGTISPTTAKLQVVGGIQNISGEETAIRVSSALNNVKIELQNTGASGKLYEIRSSNSGTFDVTNRTNSITLYTIDSNSNHIFNTAGTLFAKAPRGYLSMSGNATGASTVANTWVKLAGTTTLGATSNLFDSPVTNRIRYIGTPALPNANIVVCLTFTYGSSISTKLEFSVFKNGSLLADSPKYVSNTSTNLSMFVSLGVSTSFTTNDYIEIYFLSPTGGVILIGTDLSLLIQ